MIRPLSFVLAAALAAALPATHAVAPCNDACMALIREAHVFQSRGQYREALDKFDAAAAAAPQSSLPLSLSAGLQVQLSKRVVPDQVTAMRASAQSMARRALALAPDDPLAQEALRLLEDDGPSPLHRVNPEGAALLAQAERLFAQRRYADALGKYEEVMRLDPQFSGAWVGAGDCWFAQQAWARAESLFRRATEIEAHNSQAWRYLADTLHAQGRLPTAEQALLAAVAADPAQRTNWVKLASLRAGAGLPLKRLQLQRGAGVTIGADGNARVTVDGDLHGASPTPDASLRLALALAEASARLADKENQAARPRSPYEIELAAWHSALQASTEQRAAGGQALSDPALLQMQALERDGQLEPAILILLYRQAYRPALDAWLAAHPGGVKQFIDRYGLQP